MTQTKAELLQTRHQGDIRLGDADSTHYVGFKAPATVSSSLVWTLPATDGTANYLLKTDGSGNLGWVADSSTDSTKMPLAGGTFTGDVTFTGASANIVFDKSDNAFEFADNAKTIFGVGADLQIYHDGNNSKIINQTGNLTINATATEVGIDIIPNGAVKLYHNNVNKFETVSYGVVAKGSVEIQSGSMTTADSSDSGTTNSALFGTGNDLKIFHDGTNSHLHNVTGTLRLRGDSIKLNNAGASENYLVATNGGSVELYHNNNKSCQTDSNGLVVYGPNNGDANVYVYADDGDDNADKWKITSLASSSSFYLQNYSGGSWENSIYAGGGGAVKLSYDNSWRLETDGNGINVIDDDSTVEISLTDSNGAAGHVYGNNSSGLIALLVGNGETSVAGYQNGATQLFHDNNKKLETSSSGVTVTGTVSDSIGELRQIPQRSVSSVTLAASDVGKAVLATSTVTVPNGVFSSGDAVTIINNSGSDITISKGISTMYLASDGSSANRTLATRGMATIWFSSSSVAYISGAGLS